MSTSLYMKPIAKGKALSDALKRAVRKRYPLPVVVSAADSMYFEALADAEVSGATLVLEAIQRYGEVQLSEE